MATQIGVGDILEVKLACFMSNQLGLNVCHFAVSDVGAGGGCTDAEVALAYDVLMAPLYKAWLGNDASWYGVSVKARRIGLSFTPQVSATLIGVGTVAGGCLPGQVSGVITKRSQFAGRAFRGRVYVPFPATVWNDTVLNKPTAAAVVVLGQLANPLFQNRTVGAGVETADLVPVIMPPTGLLGSIITGNQSRQAWGTQRRRGNYGNANIYPPF